VEDGRRHRRDVRLHGMTHGYARSQ
jgi:hypothetical protein